MEDIERKAKAEVREIIGKLEEDHRDAMRMKRENEVPRMHTWTPSASRRQISTSSMAIQFLVS